MADKPVVSALTENEALSMMADAFDSTGLTKSLNSAAALTVFVPTDRAIEEMAAGRWKKLRADKKIVAGHVLTQRLSPADLLGTHLTMAGGRLSVAREAGVVRVGGAATVVCANVQTKNAVVYVVDHVLTTAGSSS
jgi:uncharacterized surface protein with fasciclin (FAS1) repeats